MRIIILDENTKITEECAVAIGKFDGVHLGHIKLLDELSKQKSKSLKTVVFTFDRPLSSFFGNDNYTVLQSYEEKIETLDSLGIDILAIYPVNEINLGIEPEDFIETVLCNKLNAKVVVAGPDLSYGKYGKGNFELLDEFSKRYGYKTIKVEKVIDDETGREISSTFVRESILNGNMLLAKKLLGRPYSISGKVKHGRKLGRQLSFPTVNLLVEDRKIVPPYGVYAANVYIGSQCYKGVSNVGVKPTISDHEQLCVETHIFDFNEELYGEYITVELLEFMRPEKRFSSVEELKEQLIKDIEAAKKI